MPERKEKPLSPHLISSQDEKRPNQSLTREEHSRPRQRRLLRVAHNVQPAIQATTDKIADTKTIEQAFAQAGHIASDDGGGKIAYVLQSVCLSSFCPHDPVAGGVLESWIGAGAGGEGSRQDEVERL